MRAAGSSWRTTRRGAVAVDDPAVERGDGRGRVRRPHQDVSGRAAQGVEIALEHQPARVHHADAVTQGVDLAEQVTGQHDGRAALVQRDQQLADLADAARVEPVRRLVEQHQLGRAQQRGGDPQALAHAERVGAHRAPVDPAEADAFQGVVDALPPVSPAARACGVDEPQVRAPGQVRPGGRPLDQRSDPRKHARGVARHRFAEQLHLARGGVHEAEQHAHEGRLARAVGTEEAEPDAGGNPQVHPGDGGDAAEPLDEPRVAITSSVIL